jgi:hypothetical protein
VNLKVIVVGYAGNNGAGLDERQVVEPDTANYLDRRGLQASQRGRRNITCADIGNVKITGQPSVHHKMKTPA